MSNERNGRGKLIVVSGFSGAGKGSLMEKLLENYPGQYALSVSVTTRAPREKEVDGISYHFKTQEEFDRLVEEGYFIEYAGYTGNSYGTPRPFVEENLDAGRNVILEIERAGAMTVREKYPDVKMIFVTTENAEILETRLRNRKTETEEKILKRLKTAVTECDYVKEYHAVIVNDVLEDSVIRLHNTIMEEENGRPSEEDLKRIARIREELKIRLGLQD